MKRWIYFAKPPPDPALPQADCRDYSREPNEALAALPAESDRYFFWNGTAKLSTCVGNARKTIDRVCALARVSGHPHRFGDTFSVRLLDLGNETSHRPTPARPHQHQDYGKARRALRGITPGATRCGHSRARFWDRNL